MLDCSGYRLLEVFSLSPQNQKEGDLSHLGNLKYILCGHFDEKTNRGYEGGKVSRHRWQVGEWLPPEKLKSRHFEKNIGYIGLKIYCVY